MSKDNHVNHESSFRPVVGIDLGTTNSAVAYIHKGRPEIIPSMDNRRIIPSVVLIDLQGRVIVGEAARAALIAMPDRTVAAVKRQMGSTEPIAIADQSLLPQEISALILKELKSYVDARFGPGEKEAVITVPAYFTDEQRRATKQAGELAGFVVERIINEPTAAALAFGLAHLDEDRHVLVYDLGGGTFDVSVVEMMSGVLEVKASTGNNRLGGEDFDWKIVDWLAEQMIAQHGIDPRQDLRAKAILKTEAEKAKIQLSRQNRVTLDLPLISMQGDQPLGLQTELTQAIFIGLIQDFLDETMTSVGKVLQDADLTSGDINEILLVGGSTRIPRVRELIQEFFGLEPRTDVHPDEAVALGAAVQAGLKSGALAKSGLVATDVAPFSMGIAVLKEWKGVSMRPGGFHVMIPRNTTIPVTRSDTFYTAADGQTKVAIEIYQGENEWVKHNHRLGEFLLAGIPPKRAGEEAIEVTYRYNLNGILEVTARCVSTGKAMSVTVQDALNRDSQEAFAESADRLEALFSAAGPREEDEDFDEDEWEWADFSEKDGANDPFGEDDDDPTVLHSEVKALLERARSVREQCQSSEYPRVDQLIASLEEALTDDDVERLRELIDEATDTLIDLEL